MHVEPFPAKVSACELQNAVWSTRRILKRAARSPTYNFNAIIALIRGNLMARFHQPPYKEQLSPFQLHNLVSLDMIAIHAQQQCLLLSAH
jgi:hypothetical protein